MTIPIEQRRRLGGMSGGARAGRAVGRDMAGARKGWKPCHGHAQSYMGWRCLALSLDTNWIQTMFPVRTCRVVWLCLVMSRAQHGWHARVVVLATLSEVHWYAVLCRYIYRNQLVHIECRRGSAASVWSLGEQRQAARGRAERGRCRERSIN